MKKDPTGYWWGRNPVSDERVVYFKEFYGIPRDMEVEFEEQGSEYYYGNTVVVPLQIAVPAKVVADCKGVSGSVIEYGKILAGNKVLYHALRLLPGQITPDLGPYFAPHAVGAVAVNTYAIIVTCSDSRVIPESIFSAGIGELFTIRVAGNVISDHQLGSVEYAADHLGSNLVVVLGHTNCGAVGAAISGGAEGFIKTITDEIKSAIGDEKDAYKASCLNVNNSIKRIEDALDIPSLKVVGAIYNIEDGSVEFMK